MDADSFDGLLDLESFNRDFEAGKLNHLLSKKEKGKKVPKKPVLKKSFPETLPSEIVEFIEVISCKACEKEYRFLKGYGLRTVYLRSVKVAPVNKITESDFLLLQAAGKFGEPFITTSCFEACPACSTIERK